MLSVDLKVLRTGCVLVCRGEVTGGKEADYLFDLMTRDDHGDVVVDLAGVTKVDEEGLSVIIAAHKLLANANRRLALSNPSTELVRSLQHRDMELMFDVDLRRATQSGAVQ
jgi:anti-anti-sigma regulatory factor